MLSAAEVTAAARTNDQYIRPVLFSHRKDARGLVVVCPSPRRREALRRLMTIAIGGIALWGCGGPEVDLTSDTTGGI